MIDLRSDTVTKPTPAMCEAMASADVGDDCYGEDPTVAELEHRAAEIMGKQAALYVPSGTMGNACALLAHASPGDIALMDAECHIYVFEHGGLAALGGLMPVLSDTPTGCPSPDFVQSYLGRNPRMYPRTALVCLENTHNRRGGRAIPTSAMAAVRDATASAGISVHLDGARVFNAATALDVPVRDIADQVDSIQFCLSKGLCAPVGSILASSEAFIDRARQVRKRLGGSMRQSGVIAAAGLIALTDMPGRLWEDHENARMLAEVLSDVPELEIEQKHVDTNMVIVRTRRLGADAEDVAERLRARGVAVALYGPTTLRYVTHHDVGRDAVKEAASISLEVFKQIAARDRRDASATQRRSA